MEYNHHIIFDLQLYKIEKRRYEMLQSKVWRWYQRHNKAIDVIMELACNAIPEAGVLKALFKAAKGLFHNTIEQKQEEQCHTPQSSYTDDSLADMADFKKSPDLKKPRNQQVTPEGLSSDLKEKLHKLENLILDIRPKITFLVEEIEAIHGFQDLKTLEKQIQLVKKSTFQEDFHSVIQEITPHFLKSISTFKHGFSFHKILNNRYGLLEKLGQGGQGAVFKAWHITAEMFVAVKLLPMELADNPVAVNSLKKEYQRLVNKLTHPNIVQYRELDQDLESKQFFIVMDYVSGEDLYSRISRKNQTPFSLEETLQILKPIAQALDFTHNQKLIHCDLKSANILIGNDGESYLTDFGLSYEIQISLSENSAITIDNLKGTLPYIPPEQYTHGKISRSSDVWAMGVLLYEMLAGKRPFIGRCYEQFQNLVCNTEPARIENLPDAAWRVVASMLEKDYRKRPKSVVECFEKIEQSFGVNQNDNSKLPSPGIKEIKTLRKAQFKLSKISTGVKLFFLFFMVICLAFLFHFQKNIVAPKKKVQPVVPKKKVQPVVPKKKVQPVVPKKKVQPVVPKKKAPQVVPKKKAPQVESGKKIANKRRNKTNAKIKIVTLPEIPGVFYKIIRWKGKEEKIKINEKVVRLASNEYLEGDLSLTQISDAGLIHFKNMQNLKQLDLAWTQISDAGLIHLKDLQNLTTLDLSDTQISDAGLIHFKNMQNLKQLDLRKTEISDAGLAKLKKYLPNTRIYK